MFRRVIARLLVLLLILPGTWAAYAHAGTSVHDPAGLDRSPHFHLRFFYLSWPRYASDQSVHFDGQEGKTLTGSKPAADHDDDAVYVPVTVLLGWCFDPPVDLVSPMGLAMPAGTLCLPETELVAISAQGPSQWAVRCHACPLYLQSLTILI
jgi:hypothetical protein